MIFRRVLLSIVTIIFSLSTAAARAEVTARVAVLPFEVYTNARNASLKDTIAHELSSRIAQEEGIAVVDQTRIKDILDSKTSFSFNEVALRSIAEKLEVPFLVLGSMTKIGENLSLDTYVFTTQGSSSFTKDFTEGKNLNSLIKKMAQKISSQILEIARASAEGQKPEPTEEPSSGELEEPAGAGTVGKDSPPVPEEQESAEMAAEESVRSEVEENTSVAGALPPQKATDEVPDQPHTPPDKEIIGDEVAEATAEEGTQRVPEAQVQTEGLDDPGEPRGEEGETATVAGLPTGDAAPPTEQPRNSGKKKRKDKSLSSPFSTMKPIQITSKSMEADNKKNMVTFKGSVVVKQEDILILSDIMKVAYEAKGGISRVEASGNVKMSQENRIATGKKLVFYNPEQKIVMTGNAKIWQGDNLISCEKVTVLLEEDKIFFEGTVDSIIYPKSIQEQDSGKKQQVEALTLPTHEPPSGNEERAIPPREGKGSLKDASP
jgi:lipopolysaccharide export system protein LptA